MDRRTLLGRLTAAGAVGLAGCSNPFATGGVETETTSPPPESTSPAPTENNQPPSLSGPWPKAHTDSANTAAVESVGPKGSPLVRWTEALRLETDMAVAVGPDGPVAVRRDGVIVAYTHDGGQRWRQTHESGFRAAPVVAGDGTIVVGREDGEVFAYEPDGTLRWQVRAGDHIYPQNGHDGTPFRLADDMVVFGTDSSCRALALADGSSRWNVTVPRETHRPAVRRGRLFLASDLRQDGTRRSLVQARSVVDGKQQWETTIPGTISIAPGLHEGRVITGDIQGRVRALDTSDGSEQWQVALPEDPWVSTIPKRFADRIWVGTLGGDVYGITPSSGKFVHVTVATPVTPAVTPEFVVFGTATSFRGERDTTLVAIDSTGEVAWRRPIRGRPVGHVLHRDGRLVVGTDSGVVETVDAGGTHRWRAFDRPDRIPSPVVGPEFVYYGSRADIVLAYRVWDAFFTPWSINFPDATPVTPALVDDILITGDRSGTLRGMPIWDDEQPDGRLVGPTETGGHYDGTSPDPLWELSVAGPIGDIGFGRHAYLGAGDTLISVTADGEGRWETDVGGHVERAPAVAGEAVYAGTTDGTVLGLSTYEGEILWQRQVGRTVTAPTLARTESGPFVLVGTDEAVVALSVEDGTEQWRRPTGHVWGSPAVADDILVAADDTGYVRGIGIHNGREQWRTETDGAIHGAPAIAGETAYVGSRDSHLYAIALGDGSVNWRFELEDWVDGSPAVAYGAVVVTDQSGSVSVIVGDE